MSVLHCYDSARCLHGSFIPGGAEPLDGLVFPVAIARSVGNLSPNFAEDVKTIQKALNRFPEAMGGPVPKLDPDGVVGPLTTGAIQKFQRRQLGFTDSKIDPGQQTIQRMNQLALTVWVSVQPRTMETLYQAILPDVLRCVLSADAALLAARQSFFGPRTGIDPGAASAALVNRHFFLDKNANAAGDFDLIQGIFRSMIPILHRNTGGAERTFIAAPGRFDAARMVVSGVLAMAFSNGVSLAGKVVNGKAQDGSSLTLPMDKVLIMVPFAFATRDAQIITLIHEMAHYMGPPDSSSDTINDPPNGSSAQSEIAKLSFPARARIAENYATFAFEAHFRRPPLRLLV